MNLSKFIKPNYLGKQGVFRIIYDGHKRFFYLPCQWTKKGFQKLFEENSPEEGVIEVNIFTKKEFVTSSPDVEFNTAIFDHLKAKYYEETG